jgi:hypothetical protein
MQIHQYIYKYSTSCGQKPVLASVFVLEVLYCLGTGSDICLCISSKVCYISWKLIQVTDEYCYYIYVLRHMHIFLYDGRHSFPCSKINKPTPSHTVHHAAMRTAMQFVFKSNAVFIRRHEGNIRLILIPLTWRIW